MHQLGILSESDVLRAHKDLGYDDTKAQQLTAFVLKLNKPKTTDDVDELGRLTRTTILDFYGDGLIPRNRAQQLLADQGLSPEAVELYLNSVDLSNHRTERKAEADAIVEKAKAGVIGFNEAQGQLMGLGLETLEVEKYITTLIRATETRTQLPTKADGDAMVKLGIITEGDYRDLLSRLGYSPRWVDAYVRLGKAKASGAQKPS
jgi:hypothetical protein